MTLMDTPLASSSGTSPQTRRSPDVFTFDEAATYLAISHDSFRSVRNQMREAGKSIGHRRGRFWLFCTEELQAARKFMFGLDGPAERPGRRKS